MEHLAELSGCDAHSTVILSQVDTDVFRKLGVNMSCEPRYQTKNSTTSGKLLIRDCPL